MKLARQEFFNSEQTRTVSRCRVWIRDTLAGKTTKAENSAVSAAIAAVPHAQDHLTGIELCARCESELVSELFRRALVLRVTRIDTLSDAAEHLRDCVNEHVLTRTRLEQLLDRVPGGLDLLESVSAPVLREHLRRNEGFGPELVGDHRLQHLIDEHLPQASIDGVNKTLLQPEMFLGSFLRPALAYALSAEERAAIAAVRTLAGATSNETGALIMPRRNHLVQALRAYRSHASERRNSSLVWLDSVIETLEPRPYTLQNPASAEAAKDLRELLYDALVEYSELLHAKLDPLVNAERLTELLGAVPAAKHVSVYPHLQRLVSGALSRELGPRGPKPSQPNVERTGHLPSTIADVLELLGSHVRTYGSLPQRSALPPDVVDAIEALYGNRPYSELVAAANIERGWALPAASSNERKMDELVKASFADLPGFTATPQWRDAEIFGKRRLAVDLHVSHLEGLAGVFQVEWLFEADGEGHFVPCHNFDLERQRFNDTEKARCVRAARRAGRDATLISLHHGVFSKLTPQLLNEVMSLARADEAWYVFVRPAGSTDDRALPSGVRTKKLRLPSTRAAGLEVRIAVN